MSMRAAAKTKKKKATPPSSSQLQVLERPQRAKYVTDKSKAKGCVFCDAYKQRPSAKSLVVHKAKDAFVVLNKYPYNSGHVLVLPASHVATLEELTDLQYQSLMDTFRWALEVVQKEYQPEGVNAGLNLGSASGAGIPSHLHWHIVPRWSGDTNFFPLVGKSKVVIETLAQSYKRLRAAFSQASSK